VLVLVVLTVSGVAAQDEASPIPPKNGTQYVVGWTPLSDPTGAERLAMDTEIQRAIEEHGGQYLYCSPSPQGGATGDPSAQANCIDGFIAQNVDAVIFSAVDFQAIVPSIAALNAAGIPAFAFSNLIPANPDIEVKMSINVDDRGAGRNNGQALVDFLTQKYGEPRGKVLEVQGAMSTGAAVERGGGFHEVVDQYPEIEVTSKPAEWDTGTATTVIQDWLTANPDTDAISLHTDCGYAPAAKSALEAIGRFATVGDEEHVGLFAEDGCGLAMNLIKCGYMEMTTDYGLANWSYPLGDVAMKYLETGALPAVGETVEYPDTTFGSVTVVEDPAITGPLMLIATKVIDSPEAAQDPALFGNSLQPAPNGLSDCE
jgi:ABC-type sugar transport system substrate-binding protein